MVSLVVQDGSYAGFGSPGASLPHDWTEGTGVIPAGGVITIPNPSLNGQTRKWLFIQNQSAVTIAVNVYAVTAQGNASIVPIILASGGSVGSQGAAQNFGPATWVANNALTITGAAGSQVAVLEVLE